MALPIGYTILVSFFNSSQIPMQFLYNSEHVDPNVWIRSSFINDILRFIIENLNIYYDNEKIIG
jgi:hypothetical protein